jgi:hypothetical protein
MVNEFMGKERTVPGRGDSHTRRTWIVNLLKNTEKVSPVYTVNSHVGNKIKTSVFVNQRYAQYSATGSDLNALFKAGHLVKLRDIKEMPRFYKYPRTAFIHIDNKNLKKAILDISKSNPECKVSHNEINEGALLTPQEFLEKLIEKRAEEKIEDIKKRKEEKIEKLRSEK